MDVPILKRDTPPEGFDPVQAEWDLKKSTKNEKLFDNFRFAKLHDVSSGVFGARKGNPHGLSRRRWIERYVKVKAASGKLEPLALNHVQRQLEAEVLRMERAGVPVRVVILKARQMGCCLAPSTRVLTSDLRWITLDELRVGQELVGVDEFPPGGKGPSRSMRKAVVEAKVELVRSAFRITMDSGQVTATPEHRFLVKTNGGQTWKEVRDLKPGDQIRHLVSPWEPATYEDGWFGGMIDGEGHLRAKPKGGFELCVTQLPGPVLDRAATYLEGRGYPVAFTENGSGQGFGRVASKVTTYRLDDILRIVGQTRPTRYVTKPWWDGRALPGKSLGLRGGVIQKIEPVGEIRVIDLQTSTKTFIAEGVVSHNSTYVAALSWWYVCTRPYGRAGIITQDTDMSEDVVKRLKLMHQEMRKESGERWELLLTRSNSGEMTLGEPLYGEVIIDSAQVAEPMRGKTVQVLHKSETPIWPDADRKADAVAQTLPDEKDTYGFDEATANGDFGFFPNQFRTAWRDNRMGTKVRFGWRGFFAPWFWDQRYRWSRMAGATPDEELEREIMETLSQEERVLLTKRYVVRGKGWLTVDVDQLAWRRYTIKNKCRGSLDAFHQEYPATPDEAFLSSGMPFFEPLLIGKMRETSITPPQFVGALVDEAAELQLALRPIPVEPVEAQPEPLGPIG